jgi:hypothetical protein
MQQHTGLDSLSSINKSAPFSKPFGNMPPVPDSLVNLAFVEKRFFSFDGGCTN